MGILKEDQWATISTEVQFRFVRSSGPGGQKVNKTASKAELRWSAISTQALSQYQYHLVLKKLENQISVDGDIIIQAETQRSRLQNKAQALVRLKELLEDALYIPKKRRKTKPKKSAVQKRLNQKKQHGDKKRQRKKVDY